MAGRLEHLWPAGWLEHLWPVVAWLSGLWWPGGSLAVRPCGALAVRPLVAGAPTEGAPTACEGLAVRLVVAWLTSPWWLPIRPVVARQRHAVGAPAAAPAGATAMEGAAALAGIPGVSRNPLVSLVAAALRWGSSAWRRRVLLPLRRLLPLPVRSTSDVVVSMWWPRNQWPGDRCAMHCNIEFANDYG